MCSFFNCRVFLNQYFNATKSVIAGLGLSYIGMLLCNHKRKPIKILIELIKVENWSLDVLEVDRINLHIQILLLFL